MKGGLNRVDFTTITSAGGALPAVTLSLLKLEGVTYKGHIKRKDMVITLNQIENNLTLAEYINTNLSATASTSNDETVTFEDNSTSGSVSSEVPTVHARFYVGTDGGRHQIYEGVIQFTENTGDHSSGAGKFQRRSIECKFVTWNGTANITGCKSKYNSTLCDTTEVSPTGLASPVDTIAIGDYAKETWIKAK